MALAIGEVNSGISPRPLGRTGRQFDGFLAQASLGGMNIAAGKFALGTPQSATIANNHTFMFATQPDLMRRVSGRKLFGSHIFHFKPGEQTVTTSPTGMPWAFGIVTLSFEQLARLTPAVLGRDHLVPLNDDRMFRVPDTGIARLVGLMHDAASVIMHTPWVIENLQSAKALSGVIVDALLSCLATGSMKQDGAAIGRHRQIIARFERALEERSEDMLSLSSICTAVGVAERTLNLACQEFLGEGPVRYARNRRLDHVRERLLTSDPASTSITNVAMDCGFWELGRFAQAYRSRFGERPSDTLRQK